MPGLVPGIHVLAAEKSWMAGQAHGCPVHVEPQSRASWRESFGGRSLRFGAVGSCLFDASDWCARVERVRASHVLLWSSSAAGAASRKAISATAIWMRTAFSERPMKWRDLQGLLDHTEEQLDLPAPLVEVGDLAAGASRSLLRIRSFLPVSVITTISRTASCIGFWRLLACRPGRKPMRSRQHARSRRAPAWSRASRERRVGLEARHDAAAGCIELGPPGVIVVAEIEDVGRRPA